MPYIRRTAVSTLLNKYDLAETTERRWVRQAEINAGLKPGTTPGAAEEVARLREQLREVTEERDILAPAVNFLATESRPFASQRRQQGHQWAHRAKTPRRRIRTREN